MFADGEQIERGQTDGNIQPEVDAEAAALLIGCAIMGIRIQSQIDPDMDVSLVKDALVQLLRLRLAFT